MCDRERRELRHLSAVHPEPISVGALRGMAAHVQLPEYDALLHVGGLAKTKHIYNAQVFVRDSHAFVRKAADDVAWAAALLGAYVISPESLRGRVGPVIKFKPAVKVDRALYISDEFRLRHEHVYNTIRMCIGTSDKPKLRTVDRADCERRLNGSDNLRNRAWALVVGRERTSVELFRKHPTQVFTGPSFLQKLTNVDLSKSFFGPDARPR